MTHDLFTSPEGYRIQKTLKAPLNFSGVGLHTGIHCDMKLIPAEPNHGIAFIRTDLKRRPKIFAHYDAVVATSMATTLGYSDWDEARVSTVEHLLAALFAMGITNLLIELSGPEIPILDGSAAPFIEAMWETGLELQPFSTAVIKVIRPIKVYENGSVCELLPREQLRLTTSIDFPHPSIGLQTFGIEMTPKLFRDEIGAARTFGFLKDLERLRNLRLAQGASLENVLAFSETGVLNPDGMRFIDECVRHKLLDAIGDLALSGCWIRGEMVSYRGGHSIHLALLKALRNHRTHWEMSPAEPLAAMPAATPLRRATLKN
jgi:UDP-3-O-[3-hydroxymyristoyl] N-acetylglucosamine deacetylase